MNFAELEAEVIAQMNETGTPAPKVNTVNNEPTDDESVSDSDLAALAAEAQARIATDGAAMRDTIWAARVRRAELAGAAAGPSVEGPRLSLPAGREPNEASWQTINELAAARDPRTGRLYLQDQGISGQRVRQLIHDARADVFAGRPLNSETLAFAKAAIKADLEAYEAEIAARDAKELADFRDKR